MPTKKKKQLRRVTVLDRIMLTGLAGVLAGAVAMSAAPGCSAADNKNATKTAVDIATATCIVLRGDVGDGTVDSICALEEELAPFIKHLVAARRKAAAASGKVGAGAKHPDDYPPVRGVDACMADGTAVSPKP